MGLEPINNRELMAHTDLLVLNKEEALTFTREDSLEKALAVFLEAGAKNVVITDGKRGATASDGNKKYICPVVSDVQILDTTGAGDAFGTGVTWGLLTGMSLPEALKAGSINGASVVASIGAQTALLTDTEINARMNEVALDVEEHSL